MSMSTNVEGIKPPDDKWRKMKKIWELCQEAKVDIPSQVLDFFGGDKPDEKGVIIELSLVQHSSVRPYNADMQSGYEVDLTKLPKDITILRFYNSY